MSKTASLKLRHPKGVKLTQAIEDDAPRLKAMKGLIPKKATVMTAGLAEGELAKLVGETMQPDSAQLAEINKFTRKPVSAEEVVAFHTLSCNDLPDRDDDQFTTECVKDFAALEHPFSSVGKSYMLDHNYVIDNAVGRLFAVDTVKSGGVQWLRNQVYVPNTEQFQPLIEKIDFGIAWAVSVGVVLGEAKCSVCGSGFSSWGYWCVNGHDKGAYYDPDSDEEDAWGWPAYADPDDPNAIKTIRQFSSPQDFYELSQVFLGAQYYASLDEKSPELAGVLKAASAGDGFVGLSDKEAQEIPLRHLPLKYVEARENYDIKTAEDGSFLWTDDQKMLWSFDPEDPSMEVLCLGKTTANDDSEEEEDGRHEVSDEQVDPDDQSDDAEGGDDDQAGDEDGSEDQSEESGVGGTPSGGEGSGEVQPVVEGAADDDPEDSEEEESEDDESEDDDSEEDDDGEAGGDVGTASVDISTIAEALRTAGLSADAIGKIASDATGKQLSKTITGLSKRAAIGDQYLTEIKSDVLDWYVRSRTNGTAGVKTEAVEKVIANCGDDIELLKALIEDYKSVAQEKFPKAVRRSTTPADPNEAPKPKTSVEAWDLPSEEDNAKSVRSIHI